MSLGKRSGGRPGKLHVHLAATSLLRCLLDDIGSAFDSDRGWRHWLVVWRHGDRVDPIAEFATTQEGVVVDQALEHLLWIGARVVVLRGRCRERVVHCRGCGRLRCYGGGPPLAKLPADRDVVELGQLALRGHSGASLDDCVHGCQGLLHFVPAHDALQLRNNLLLEWVAPG